MILMLAIGLGTLNEAAAQCTVEVFVTQNPGNCSSQVAIGSTASGTVQSWTYYIDGNIVGTNSSSFVNLQPGTYVASVVVITDQNCTAADDFSFTVAGSPLIVDAGADVISCQQQATLSVNVNSTNPYLVNWYPSQYLDDPTSEIPTVTENVDDQWFIVDVVDTVTGCVNSDTIQVTQQIPLIDTLNLCTGSATIDLGPGAAAYNWQQFTDTAGNTVALNYPSTQQAITVTEPGEYLIIADYVECGALTSVVTVEACQFNCFNAFTQQTITQDQCGDIYEFVSTGTGALTSWSWDFGDGTTSSFPSPNHVFTTGTYEVTLTTTNSDGCTAVSSQTYTSNNGLSLTMSNDTIGCQEEAYMEVFPSGGSGDYSYSWTPTQGVFSDPTQPIFYVEGVHEEVYHAYVTDNVTGCVRYDSVKVSSYDMNTQTLDLCTGTALIDLGPGATAYHWLSFEDTLGNSSPLNYLTTQQAINVQEPGTYFAYADFPNCGALTSLVTVVACSNQNCYSDFITVPNPQQCGSLYDFAGQNFSSATDSVVWDYGNGETYTDNGGGEAHFFTGGVYVVTMTAYHLSGCISTSSQTITVNSGVTIELIEDTLACNGMLQLNHTISGGSGGYIYDWYPQAAMNSPTVPFPTMTVTADGWVEVHLEDTQTGCTAVDSMYVYANAAINETLQLCDDSVLLAVNPGSQVYNWSYTDEFGNTTQLQTFGNAIYTDEIGTYICFTYYSGCNTVTHSFVVEECATQNDDVWPGDANSDGVVTNSDALYLGLAFNQTGPNRPAATLNWVGQPCPDWTFNFAVNNVNLKHADCDGNGIINFDDTLAIEFNYLNTHNKFEGVSSGGNPPIWVEATPDTVGLEQAIDIVVHLGSVDQPVDSLHGVAFSLLFDQSLFTQNGFTVDFDNCVLGTAGNDVLTFQKNLFNDGVLDVAVTRNTLENFQGYGPIIHARIVTTDNLSGVHDAAFGIGGVVAITASETPVELSSIPDTVVIDPNKVGIDERGLENILIYPNPATDVLNITGLVGSGTVSVLNTMGQEALAVVFQNSDRIVLNLSELTSGVYLVQIRTANSISTRKLRLIRS